MINRIVTKRNTVFIVGFPMDSSENSPIIEKIIGGIGDIGGMADMFTIICSNKTVINVKDVVETWNNEIKS